MFARLFIEYILFQLSKSGAGDSFIGAFLVGYLDGLSMEEALEKGAESARHTCTFYGGFGYPEELEG